MTQASDLFHQSADEGLLKALRMSGIQGQLDRVEELTVKFSEHQEQLQEVGVAPRTHVYYNDQYKCKWSKGDYGGIHYVPETGFKGN